MSYMGDCHQQKHTQHASSAKMECDYLNGWIKNSHMRKNLPQNGEPQRCSWEGRRRVRNKMSLLGNGGGTDGCLRENSL